MLKSEQPAVSTAEAKLQRQNERIQLAEAALANPSQLDRSRPESRAKSKFPPSLRPSDESVGSARSRNTSVSSSGVAVETRVNSYRSERPNPPRHYPKSSLDISAAVGPEAVEMERNYSGLDHSGFQTYTGRRSSRRGELCAYEDKTEVKQTTVEATVDQREILAVFANPLPGLEFLTCQAGRLDGQVQFVQHPNGDVSAHMWSKHTYQWSNIGHFSNIRKKIEGQLAGDHLKGETAYQKLKQNTLAYFRTIAKQREAAATGLDFGQTEIQQLLPEPTHGKHPEIASKRLSAASPAFLNRTQDSSLPMRCASEDASAQSQLFSQQRIEPAASHAFFIVPQGPRTADNACQPPLSPKHTRTAEDPFAINAYGPTFTRLGPEYNGGTVAGPPKQHTFNRPSFSNGAHQFAHAVYTQAAVPAAPDVRMTCKPLPSSRTPSSETVGRSFGSQSFPHSSATSISSFLPARVAGTGPDADRRHLSAISMDSLRGKPVTPLQAREAMRENLFKISDHAVERSVSRENLQNLNIAAAEREQRQSSRRTVLHDPFQSDDRNEVDDFESSSISHRSDGEPQSAVMQVAPRPLAFHKPGMPPHWVDSQSAKNLPLSIEIYLTDCVADIIGEDFPIPTTRAHSNFIEFNADPRMSCTSYRSSDTSATSPNQQLNTWWTSGTKFARQEGIYQSMKAIADEAPIALASTTPASSAAGDILTRVLIPVCENLASYVEGPVEKRRDYWSHWVQAPEWCIDRRPNGNNSFYEDTLQPPLRMSRESRHASTEGGIRIAGVAVPASLERRLEHNRWS